MPSLPLHIVSSGSGNSTLADYFDLGLIGLLWLGTLLLVFEARQKRTVRGVLLPTFIIAIASVGLLLSYVVLPSFQEQGPPAGAVFVTIWPGSDKSLVDEPRGFVPLNLTLNLLTISTVAWNNSDSVVHTVHSDTGEFDLGQLQPGQVKWYTFTRGGVFAYHCDPHPWRTGTITVLTN